MYHEGRVLLPVLDYLHENKESEIVPNKAKLYLHAGA